jgi:hypothetical protein
VEAGLAVTIMVCSCGCCIYDNCRRRRRYDSYRHYDEHVLPQYNEPLIEKRSIEIEEPEYRIVTPH